MRPHFPHTQSFIRHYALGIMALCIGFSIEAKAAAPDSTIYQGMSVKLDLGNTIIELATSKAKVQSYEIAMNWRLIQRLYPTLELGYAYADANADGAIHHGQGGFARLGLDINGLKKHPESPHALLVGLRLGTALQGYDLTNISLNAPYWGNTRADYHNLFHADCWGEVVAGCQVQVYKGFQMGWYLRFKVLFTRSAKDYNIMNTAGSSTNNSTNTTGSTYTTNISNALLPYYIPGFGYRADTNWGFNYYIAYSF